jgi:hypothetical protein
MFRLMAKDDLDEIIREYYADCGLVSGLRMGSTLKNLKNLHYSNMDYNGNHENTNNSGASK